MDDKTILVCNDTQSSLEWFNKDEPDSKLIKNLDAVVKSRQDFKARVQGSIKKYRSQRLSTTREELDLQIMSYDDLKSSAVDAIHDATKGQNSWDNARASGMKSVGRKAQNFLSVFSDFLKAYSGIIELLRGAGQVYSEVAYKTLSIFLVIVVNKCRNDERIGGLISELRKSLPQLDDWTTIYPSQNMKMLVTEVYMQVIDFARTASIYFTKFSTRLWMAIGRPPSIGIDETTNIVHKKLAEVSSEAMIELHKRNSTMHQTIIKMELKINSLYSSNQNLLQESREIKQMHEASQLQKERDEQNADLQALEKLRGKLNLPWPDVSTNAEECLAKLEKSFHAAGLPSGMRYKRMTPEYLQSLEAWKSWHDSEVSSMLVLEGLTIPAARSTQGSTYSWLSPASMYTTDEIRKRGDRVAFYSCHPELRRDLETSGHHGREILASLAYQLLKHQPAVLKQKAARIDEILDKKEWKAELDIKKNKRAKDKKAALIATQTWMQLFKEIVSGTGGNGIIYLILDRLELMDGCDPKQFMEELIDLLHDTQCLVKIFIVLDSVESIWTADDASSDSKVMVVESLRQTMC